MEIRTAVCISLLQLFGFMVMGHVEMSWPYPMHSRFNPQLKESQRHYNMTSPLESDGSDFPCKAYHREAHWNPTAMLTAGEVHNITLQGTATHGGGSCQVSLSIPLSSSNGNALLAWSWQNKVGNREFYMDCAQVEISAGIGTLDDLVSLPRMWEANLEGITECKTTENVEPVYPSPGDDVEYGGGLNSSSPASLRSCEMPSGEKASKTPKSSSLEATILNSTNTYRARHLAKPLTWNTTLAEFAEQHAKNCVFEHSGGPYGENLAASYLSPTLAIDDWAAEEQLYNYTDQMFTSETGHFTQLVWQSTIHVGCANVACNGNGTVKGDYLVCEYSPTGNVEGEFGENVRKNVSAKVMMAEDFTTCSCQPNCLKDSLQS